MWLFGNNKSIGMTKVTVVGFSLQFSERQKTVRIYYLPEKIPNRQSKKSVSGTNSIKGLFSPFQ